MTTAEAPVDQKPTESPLAENAKRLRDASRYLHLGEGAEQCPDRGEYVAGQWVGDGRCENPDHYHAWLRIPNQFQKTEAREKALAAKARRTRLLRTDGTDAYEILESDLLDVMAAAKIGGDKILKDELVAQHRYTDSIEAYHEVTGKAEWETISADRDRLDELERELEDNPDVPPSDELTMLRERVTAYSDEIKAAEKVMQDQHYLELDGLTVDQLIDRVREVRIEMQSMSEFIHVESWWTWLLGAHDTTRNAKGLHRTRKYPHADDLRAEEEEIISALQIAFAELEEPVRARAEGNS